MKHVQVRLEDREFEALQHRMKERDSESQQEAIKEAIADWCNAPEEEGSPLGKLTAEERRFLRKILHVRRNEKVLKRVLDEIAKEAPL